MYAIHGKDYYDNNLSADDQISWGGDIFASNMDRPDSHGHEIGQGMQTNIKHLASSISFLINPKNNMNFSVGFRIRSENSDLVSETNTIINIGLRTSLRNFYYDF